MSSLNCRRKRISPGSPSSQHVLPGLFFSGRLHFSYSLEDFIEVTEIRLKKEDCRCKEKFVTFIEHEGLVPRRILLGDGGQY